MDAKPIAYVGGTFDLFHVGHVNLLRNAKEAFGRVVASLNTDEFVERYKKRRPAIPLGQRMAVVAACRYVDRVIVNIGNEDSKPAILLSAATHIIHGNDWTGKGLQRQMGLTEEWLKAHNIVLVYFPYTPGISSTEIRRGGECLHSTSAFRLPAHTT